MKSEKRVMPEQKPPGAFPDQEHALLTSLLHRSKIYKSTTAYRELLDFVSRLPHIAPFNALLLNIQKPGLRFAASDADWYQRFNRTIVEGARPLVILWPFGPVAFVYDIEDTRGDPLPEDVTRAFRATGPVTSATIEAFKPRLAKLGVDLAMVEYGDGHAGHIAVDSVTVVRRSFDRKNRPEYRVRLNSRHVSNVQFATLLHELAHLYLGHLGGDAYLTIPDRSFVSHSERELEAEALSYLICQRSGVQSNAETYLAGHVQAGVSVERLDPYALMRAAGHVETALGLALPSRVI